MDNNTPGNVSISRKQLLDVWRAQKSIQEKNAAVLSYVMDTLRLNLQSEIENVNIWNRQIKNFNSNLGKKWKDSNRTLATFQSKFSRWLNEPEIFCIQNRDTQSQPGPSSRPSRVPYKSFADLTPVSKRRKVKPLIEKYSQEELSFAAQTSLVKSGQRDSAKILKEVSESPRRATIIKNAMKVPQKQPTKYTIEEALALYIDGRFTKHSYKLMQSGAKLRHANIYPSYELILKAKKECYPEEQYIVITETSAEVRLQALADHTASRLVKSIDIFISKNTETIGTELTLIHKWGCDGSSGHSLYKQKFSEDENTSQTDAFLFSVCMVPLQLNSVNGNRLVWQNPKPSSTRFCRPIKILFQKETHELTKAVVAELETQIGSLLPTQIVFSNEHTLRINHVFKMTMLNGKTFSVLTDSSTQSCAICGATPKIMNYLEKLRELPRNTTAYEYGISPLHAWIRSLECMLHIAYRINIKKWQIRSKEDKEIFEETKRKIQNELKIKLGLLVDITKPGYGTTNDGNTASRFFENYTIAANITGLDEHLLKRLKIVLQVISCGYAVNVDAFEKYALDTASLYVELYPWFYMPSSLHKVLIHGAEIIQSAILPIGMFSEEALEARNKDLRKYRENHTRKFSRIQTMTDLFHTLLYSSDPFISTLSKSNNIALSDKHRKLEKEVVELLSNISHVDDTTDSDSSD